MIKIGRSVIAALVLGILAAGVSGCKNKEGPMERTGKEIDKVAEKTGRQVDKVAGKVGKEIERSAERLRR